MKNKGFTLIESLVAITIVALAVSGPLYAANRALVAAQISRDRLTAIYLAQEAIEQARYVRDSFYLDAYRNNGGNTTAAWDVFRSYMITNPGCFTPKVCTIEPTTHTFVAFTPTTNPPPAKLSMHPTNGQYTQAPNGSPTSIFTRTVQVVSESTNGIKAIEVVATTVWTSRGISYSASITDHLTAWQ